MLGAGAGGVAVIAAGALALGLAFLGGMLPRHPAPARGAAWHYGALAACSAALTLAVLAAVEWTAAMLFGGEGAADNLMLYAVALGLVVGLMMRVLPGGRMAVQYVILAAVVLLALDWLTGIDLDRYKYVAAVLVASAVAGAAHARHLRQSGARARRGFEQLGLLLFAGMAAAAILVTVGIVASVIVESVNFFGHVPLHEFLFGLQWSPQIAIRDDQVGASGAFGFVPLLTGTLLISCIAMAAATPIGLLSAIYMSEFASRRTRAAVKPILEALAGVPTIVYGFFAVVFLSPLLTDIGKSLGVGISAENALAAGLVMGAMLIPIIGSLAEDAFHAVPDSLRQGALGLGATRCEMALGVVFPAALPGVAAGLLLGFSRAVGETMIVVMAAGVSAALTLNPLEAVTTVTVQIVTLLTGDQAFDDAKTLAAFALGLALFAITLIFNLVALMLVRRFRERYE